MTLLATWLAGKGDRLLGRYALGLFLMHALVDHKGTGPASLPNGHPNGHSGAHLGGKTVRII